MVTLEFLQRSYSPVQHFTGTFRIIVSQLFQTFLQPENLFAAALLLQHTAIQLRLDIAAVFRFRCRFRCPDRHHFFLAQRCQLQRILQLRIRFGFILCRNMDHSSFAAIVINPLGIRHRQPDTSVAGTTSQCAVAGSFHILGTYGVINHRMERDG